MSSVSQLPDMPLTQFGDNIWIVDGPIVKDMGLSFSTRMIVVKLLDNSLWVCDPVKISDNTLKAIENLGEIKYLVASTQRHVWRLNNWHEKYPKAQLWSCGHIPKKLREMPYTGMLDDASVWNNDFDQILFKGNRLLTEIVFLHKVSKTVIMGDLIQNNEKIHGKPITNLMFKISGAAYPNGGVGFDLKRTFSDKEKAKESLTRILSWDFDKLIIAHGPCITSGAKKYIKSAFAWL